MKRKNVKKLKRLLALGLAFCMFVLTACGTGEKNEERVIGEIPDYLNLEGFRPIVKEGEEITLTVGGKRDTGCFIDGEDTWFVHFMKEKMNVNLDVTDYSNENVQTKKNLMLTSGNLPDMLIGVTMSHDDIMKHGVNGDLLLPISDYFSEELTPNIMRTLKEHPEIKELYTAPDGKMYTLPEISADHPGSTATIGKERFFVDKRYMEAAGIKELPTTLDELLDMLRAFKKLDPAELGVEEIWPIITEHTSRVDYYFRSIFGWMGETVTSPVWDVEEQSMVLPYMTDKYAEYIKFMNTLYQEGLIHPDYYTMNGTTALSYMSTGQAGVIATAAPYVSGTLDWDCYVQMPPVTSEFCSTPCSLAWGKYIDGSIYISENTKYPELCVRILDYMYSEEGSVYLTQGPPAGSEDCLDMIEGYTIDENNYVVHGDVENGDFASAYNFSLNMLELGNNYSVNNEFVNDVSRRMVGIENPTIPPIRTDDAAGFATATEYEAQNKYLVQPMRQPWLNEDQLARYSDLNMVINDYVIAETSKFVVGQRPLNEIDDMQKELEKLGSKEFYELCRELYSDYVK